MQLAEKLNITNRAVSKWETGKSIPDISVMPELCEIFDITVNELLSGERIDKEDYVMKAETSYYAIGWRWIACMWIGIGTFISAFTGVIRSTRCNNEINGNFCFGMWFCN